MKIPNLPPNVPAPSTKPRVKETAEYDAAIRAVCASGGYTYIPTSDVIGAGDLLDGCHPNAAGHAKLCERVAEFVKD